MAETEDNPEVDPGVGLEVAPEVDPEDVPEVALEVGGALAAEIPAREETRVSFARPPPRKVRFLYGPQIVRKGIQNPPIGDRWQ